MRGVENRAIVGDFWDTSRFRGDVRFALRHFQLSTALLHVDNQARTTCLQNLPSGEYRYPISSTESNRHYSIGSYKFWQGILLTVSALSAPTIIRHKCQPEASSRYAPSSLLRTPSTSSSFPKLGSPSCTPIYQNPCYRDPQNLQSRMLAQRPSPRISK